MPSPSPRRPGLLARAAALCGVLALSLGVLLTLIRPWYNTWGSTPEELATPLPGAALAPGPVRETRVIAVAAPADQVFAWVAQLGQDRAGFYSYELLEDLAGCEMPSLRQLDPALQHWSVGSKLWMYPRDELDGMGHATLIYHEPGRALVFGTHTPYDPPGSAPTGSWSFVVVPTGSESSRLITRASGRAMPTLLGMAVDRTVFEPVHFAMERRMLEGIRGLAEGHPISSLDDTLELLSWLGAFSVLVMAGALVLRGHEFWKRLGVFAAAAASFQLLTLAQPQPLWGLGLVLALALLLRPSARPSGDAAVLEPA